MGFDAALILGNCHQHLCNPVSYVVPHQIFHQQKGYEHTQTGQHKIQKIDVVSAEKMGSALLDELHEPIKQYCRQSAECSYDQRQQKQYIPLGKA